MKVSMFVVDVVETVQTLEFVVALAYCLGRVGETDKPVHYTLGFEVVLFVVVVVAAVEEKVPYVD